MMIILGIILEVGMLVLFVRTDLSNFSNNKNSLSRRQ